MIIQSGSVTMSSRRSYDRTTASSSSISLWGNGFSSNNQIQMIDHYHEGSGEFYDTKDQAADSNDQLLNEFKQAQSISSPFMTSRTKPDIQKLKEASLNYLLMLLFGKSSVSLKDYLADTAQETGLISQVSTQQPGGMTTDSYYYSEKEMTSFSTTGTVKTADGREMSFNLSLTMSRAFEEAYTKTTSFGAPQLCDPLVINLNTSSANVTDQTFFFDLDADGHAEKISQLASGSGFLAYDTNGDGIINDGNELFGTKSGDGFADLASYDEDGNGWIDENDPIFDKLRIWTKDVSGKDVLCALGKAGVGAIYLGNSETEFSLNSKKDNTTNALIRKTGIFLYEKGGCGTIQHVDMAKK
ncbi:hypothetical protein H8S17_11050 [Roseburia sp. BX1005]|uniref:VCBS repeat-containing protein n=1 Tax=Roseburia zhanii TaxID=2763064 RepID=A0A923RTI8_9FIRM|nr:hypothetical protein [Roseburia zhanii]